jgi:hypothetical protein
MSYAHPLVVTCQSKMARSKIAVTAHRVPSAIPVEYFTVSTHDLSE